MKVPQGERNLRGVEASALLSEAALFRKVLEEFTSLNEVHDKVDAEVLYEHVVHGYDEGVVNLVQNLFLQVQVLQAVMLKHDVLPNALHCIKLLGVPVLNQEHLSKSALANDVDHLEVLKLDLNFSCSTLEDDL